MDGRVTIDFAKGGLVGGVDATSVKQLHHINVAKNKNPGIYSCDNWDSNPDLEHGKLEFYP